MGEEFVDLLEEYISAREVLRKAEKEYTGYEFGYHFHDELSRERKARAALNKFFDRIRSCNCYGLNE